MAKWGEGDPRWIVEERADATNVNNWHWTEKNATPWSKDKIKELLTGLKIENNEFVATIKNITKIEGEATANNRKAKLIFFYEWVITGEWEGQYKNVAEMKVYKGTFEVPNLSEENDPKDIDVNISIKDEKQQKLKDFMRTKGTEDIRDRFATYITLLKEEFSQGLILPTKDQNGSVKSPPNGTDKKVSACGNASTGENGKTKESTTNNGPAKILTKKLTMNEEFKCRVEELYNVFTNPDMVKVFTQSSKIVYECEKGGKFSLFDSNITGSFVELTPNKRITMNWRNKRWPDEHYSSCTLDFTEKEDCTLLTLTQNGIPHTFVENTEDGWNNFYFRAIKSSFGFGSSLF